MHNIQCCTVCALFPAHTPTTRHAMDDESIQLTEQRARAGSVHDMQILAVLARDSGDTSAAIKWFEQAANAGNADAMYNLANLYVSLDSPKATRWYKRGAEAGQLDAMYELGKQYIRTGNVSKALQWFERVSQAGVPAATYELGQIEEYRGSRSNATVLYEQAALAGDRRATLALEALGRRVPGHRDLLKITPVDIDEAMKVARDEQTTATHEELQCPVCMIFNFKVALGNCGHVLCANCYIILVEDCSVTCPQCKVVSDKRVILFY